MKNVLVTGSTGNIGRQLVAQLLAKGATVRAMARDPRQANLPPEAEVVRGDWSEPASIDACVKGVDAVFLLWPVPDTTLTDVVSRIAKHARRVVVLSNQTVRDDQDGQDYIESTLHARVERAVAASGVEWTFLRPGVFATNALLWWAPQIRRGDVVRWSYPRAHGSPIHEGDIAAVAARVLLDDGHAGAKYILTGPQSLSLGEQVQILGEVLGRPLRFEEMPLDTAPQELSAYVPPVIALMLLQAWRERVDRPEIVTSTVAEITGRPARTFRKWAAEHRADFQLSAASAR